HWKPGGVFFPQLRSIKLSAIGTFSLVTKTLALIAVQRQTPTSRSRSPSRRGQHCLFSRGMVITGIESSLTHTSNLRKFLGHELEDGFGFGVPEELGVVVEFGFGGP
ncbi:hypothetical protein CFOL_v3_32463, partial [Cephalotus follicularis]